jgi:hypothetical protein
MLAAVGIAGCSTKPTDLAAKTKAEVHTYSENYQEIYRRVASTAKRCQSGNVNAYASYDVDAELYSELGYGEVSMSLVNVGTRNYFWTAKIEKAGTGSKLTVNSGNTLASGSNQKSVVRWASGDENCT